GGCVLRLADDERQRTEDGSIFVCCLSSDVRRLSSVNRKESTMKLYGFPPSPNTWKVRAVAAQLGIPLDLALVDLTKPRTPNYLALNPTGRTPTLVDSDLTLTE